MIDPKHDVSITRQAELVGISRAAVYYVPRLIPTSSAWRFTGNSCVRSIIALRSAVPPW